MKSAAAPAIPANDFLNSIGTQSAISVRGENFTKTIECTGYLGVRWLRSGIEGDVPLAQLITLHQQTGVRFSWGFGSGRATLSQLITTGRQMAAAGALLAFEGPNEPNNWGFTYQDEAGGRILSWLPVARLQRDLYQAVKSDSVLQSIPVWSISENGAETDNVGLQFLTIPPNSGALLPAGTHFADYANVHNYIYHPNAPGVAENKTWDAADPTAACKVDGLYGEYGRTWARHFPGYPESDLTALPKVTTETGCQVGGAVTEEIHGRNLLSLYLDQFKRGWSYTAVYLLRDRVDEGGNQQFGFYKPDYSPRPAALYLHNLTTLLADSGPGRPGRLDYSITGQTPTVHDLLLRKSSGAYSLVVWDERIAGQSDPVTIKLGQTFATVKVYDPTVGVVAIRTLTQTNSVDLVLSDHPVIIEPSLSAN